MGDSLPEKTFRPVKRKAVKQDEEQLVSNSLWDPDKGMPLVIQPEIPDVDLLAWTAKHRELINTYLAKHGALLFRGFAIDQIEAFEQFIQAVSGEALEYRERSSPRSRVKGNVYTSTEYPADQHIFLHNENSYQQHWPLKLFFCCLTPAQAGGETPIANVQKVLQRLPAQISERFREKQWMYIRNFHAHLGLSWQTVFQTDDRAQVEQYCRENAIAYEWRGNDQLRTWTVRPAIVKHPQSGEELWFNHAAFFHISTLTADVQSHLRAEFAEKDLPWNTYYGDATEIEAEVIETVRQAYREETVTFPWQRNDILLVDNMLVAHGRNPFQGSRQVVVGMAEMTEKAQDE